MTTKAKRLNMKQKYEVMTRGLDWEPTYQDPDDVFPYDKYEGIKIVDWDKFEDPFRLTMDSYWKYQAEKERKLYAILDSVAQNNSQLNISDARYMNAVKIWMQGVTPLELQASRAYAMLGRGFRGAGLRVACQFQSIDEMRHHQTQTHAFSHYNKFFNGFNQHSRIRDRAWYLSIPKSYFEDAMSSGPFELITAISFSFEYVLTNLLFMPFVSGAAYNGDMATTTFGFSAQSDESRHMTLGLEIIKFMLEQHEDNVPIVQGWLDKWFWRGYRLLGLVGTMMDYMLPKKVMSWRQAWEIYWEENGIALFNDLARYGIRLPKHHETATKEKYRITHEFWSTIYQFSHATALYTWIPTGEELDWFSAEYGEIFDTVYRPRYELWDEMDKKGERFFQERLPVVCNVCQIPIFHTMPDDPLKNCCLVAEHKGTKHQMCSEGCLDIFNHEPEKYCQSYIPPQQIYQGNCGGATLDDYKKWLHIRPEDTGEYYGSEDHQVWESWQAQARKPSDEAA